MTGAEMIESFRIYYDRITSFSAPGYLDEEILIFLNNAQDDFVKERAFGKNWMPPALDDNAKRVADLSTLNQIAEYTPVASTEYGSGNTWKVDKTSLISSGYLYTIGVQAEVSRSGYPTLTQQFVECHRIKTEIASKFVNSGVNRTHFINPKHLEIFSSPVPVVILIGDSHTTDIHTARISFIAKPTVISDTTL